MRRPLLLLLLLAGCKDAPPAPPAADPPPAAAPAVEDGSIDPATGLIRAPGWALVAGNCSGCHSLKLVTQNRGDRDHWIHLIRWMQATQNLWPIAPEVEEPLVAYLATHYGPRETGRRPPLDVRALPPPAPLAPDAAPVQAAQAALAPIKQGLKAALVGALQAQGPVGAIDTCRTQAPALSKGPDGVQLGRVSHRLRNPDNALAPWQETLYAELQRAPGTPYLTRQLPGDRVGYLEPIRTAGMCLTCHGEQLAEPVRAALSAAYPADRATGFHEGDLRGAFWAIVPAR
ncbi:MAG: DUF3365 domain-containing protein [bacterium]